jgi:hypothetical protein
MAPNESVLKNIHPAILVMWGWPLASIRAGISVQKHKPGGACGDLAPLSERHVHPSDSVEGKLISILSENWIGPVSKDEQELCAVQRACV